MRSMGRTFAETPMRLMLAPLLLLAACTAHADLSATRTAFETYTGAKLVFERADLAPGDYYDRMPTLSAAQREKAATMALREARKYPPGYLASLGLKTVGVFAALVSDTSDGFRPFEPELKGYRYFGIWNGRDAIAAAFYTDEQLPLTFHHEVFHAVDATVDRVTSYDRHFHADDVRFAAAIGGRQPYAAAKLDAEALAALGKHAEGHVLEGAVADYARKNPGEDQAETARYLMTSLPDALLQVARKPELAGSQRMLHVLGRYATARSDADLDWFLGVALGKPAPDAALSRARQRRLTDKDGFVVWGREDEDGANHTLRRDVRRVGSDLAGLSTSGLTADRRARAAVRALGFIARYHAFIDDRWNVTTGTRAVFDGAREAALKQLPESYGSLSRQLGRLDLESLAGTLDTDPPTAEPLTHWVTARAAASHAVNLHLAKVDDEVPARLRATIRRVQPAAVRVGNGSGVNIAPEGRILTAGHVPKRVGQRLVAEFPDGSKYPVVCTTIDTRLDLAVLSVIGAADLPFARVAAKAPAVGAAVVVVGQPGGRTPSGEATNYPPFNVSVGEIRGFRSEMLGDQSLGATKHDAWTYWGHSGSPLFNTKGEIVAIHNSWDPRTAMRHAVPQQAIQHFLERSAANR